MNHKIIYLRHILQLLYDCTVLYLIALGGVSIFTENTPEYSMVFAILVMLILSYIIRAKAPNYVLIFLGHISMAGLGFLLPFAMVARVILALECSYMLESSFDYAYRKGQLKTLDDPPWPSFLIVMIIYFMGEYQHVAMLPKACYISAIIMLVLYLGMLYLEGIRDYLRSTQDVAGVPIHNMIGTNNIVFAGIMICLFVAFALGYILDFSFIFKTLGRGLVAVLKVIALFLNIFYTLIAGWLKGGTPTAGPPRMDDVETIGRFHEIGQAFEVILQIVVIIAFCYLAYKLMKRFWKRLMMKRGFADDIVENADVRMPKKQENVKKSFLQRLRLTPEEKARKIYRQRVERHKYDISLDKSRSGREIATELKEREMDDIMDLTSCYEDIRYGGANVDKDMLKKMNVLSKK